MTTPEYAFNHLVDVYKDIKDTTCEINDLEKYIENYTQYILNRICDMRISDKESGSYNPDYEQWYMSIYDYSMDSLNEVEYLDFAKERLFNLNRECEVYEYYVLRECGFNKNELEKIKEGEKL